MSRSQAELSIALKLILLVSRDQGASRAGKFFKKHFYNLLVEVSILFVKKISLDPSEILVTIVCTLYFSWK